MAWSIAALIVLAVALTILGRARRRPPVSTGSPSSPAPPEEQPRPDHGAGRAQEPEPPASKSCPACLSEYAPHHRYCMRDGAELIDGRLSGPFAQGMICPTCRRGYPTDASFCPEDADELVPYGLFGATTSALSALRPNAHKICPECGVRHAPAHFFCGHDGTELVVVN